MLPTAIENSDALRDLLSQRRDGTVEFLIPQRGRKTRLLQLAEKNALEKARQAEATWEAETRNTLGALMEIQHILKLPSPPRRIEGYDISHLHGTETVGSMVVFRDGKAANDQYRSFTIRTMKEGEVDDYRALREILTRRLRHISGGLRRELAIRKKMGFTIRKAQKADIQGIEALIKTHPVMNATDLNDGTFFVVEKKKMIIGCCRVYEHPTKLKELRSLCIADTERGNRLGQSLVRMLLAKQKHDKIYIIIDPALEEYYAETSFRHVLRVPLALTQKIERILAKNPQLQRLETMVYDPKEHKPDRSLESTPDLLVIDGGKGQLSVTTDMLRQAGLTIPVIALAKREEELFVPDSRKPVPIPKDSPALFLLMRLRDEAHRFANRHREKRTHRHLHL
ncbi:hypothetical protein HYW11_03350 [Candidatus Peregrinibacteria bacterium]|nr:hypothetical protein [Candidatus Peregrinibacteria bacterium]